MQGLAIRAKMQLLQYYREVVSKRNYRKLLWAYNEVALRTEFTSVKKMSAEQGVYFVNLNKVRRYFAVITDAKDKNNMSIVIIEADGSQYSLEDWLKDES